MNECFEEVEHTADVALRVWGEGIAALFVNAARGLIWLLADPAAVEPTIELSVELEAYDAETLLVSWLGELLYLHERDDVLFTEFDLEEVTETRLRGVVRGGPIGEPRYHIKAVTFSEMAIQPGERGLETIVVFDV
jgi:SHS2 domain-containing protein